MNCHIQKNEVKRIFQQNTKTIKTVSVIFRFLLIIYFHGANEEGTTSRKMHPTKFEFQRKSQVCNTSVVYALAARAHASRISGEGGEKEIEREEERKREFVADLVLSRKFHS